MRYFLLGISALIIFTSCNTTNSGGQDEFQPQRIGNFMQVSQTRLNWVGNTSIKTTAKTSAQGDTTFYEAPNGNALRIDYVPKDSGNDLFAVVYTDSSYSFAYFDSTEAKSDANFVNPFSDIASASGGVSEDYFQLSITVTNFSCDSTYNFDETDDFEFHILNDSGNIFESIIVDTDGVAQAMRGIGC